MIEYSQYKLKTVRGNEVREGKLLRVTFEDIGRGLSDLMPWPEIASPPLMKFALQAARDEAVAIAERRPLLHGLQGSIANHFLVMSVADLAPGDLLEARRQDFRAIKVKIAKAGDASLDEESEALGRLVSHMGELKLRLDANERATAEGLSRFLDRLPVRLRERIDFIEDPFLFEATAWAEFSKKEKIRLAVDWPLNRSIDWRAAADLGAFAVYVHKPACNEEAEAIAAREHGLELVVTSMLGHPVGNIWAASRAAVLAPEGVHGCMSHLVYRDDEASRAMLRSRQINGARIFSGVLPGLGFDAKWLQRLKWSAL